MCLKNDKEYFVYLPFDELHYSLLFSMALQIFKNNDLCFEIIKHLFDKRPFDVVLRKQTTKNENFEFLFTIENYRKFCFQETRHLNQFLGQKLEYLINKAESNTHDVCIKENVYGDLEETYHAIIKCNHWWDTDDCEVLIEEFDDIPFLTRITQTEINFINKPLFHIEEICMFWRGAYDFLSFKLENTEKRPFLSNTVPFYHSLTSKKNQKAFIKTIKRNEIDAYNYCQGSISFEKAVKEYY